MTEWVAERAGLADEGDTVDVQLKGKRDPVTTRVLTCGR